MQPLFPKTILVWRIRLVCVTAVGLFLCGALGVFSFVLSVVAGVVLLCVFLVSCLWYCPRRYTSYRWYLDEGTAQIYKGVFFQVQRILPLSQVSTRNCCAPPRSAFAG